MKTKLPKILIITITFLFIFFVLLLLLNLIQNKSNLINNSGNLNSPANLSQNSKVAKLSIIAVGDTSCSSEAKSANLSNLQNCRSIEVLDRISKEQSDLVLMLGDLQYDAGLQKDYEENFLKDIKNINTPILATPGNHDYGSGNANFYLTLPNYKSNILVSNQNNKTYYYKDYNNWRIISLDSNCEYISGCDEKSEEYKWLQSILTTSNDKYILAFWHHPIWNVGRHRSVENTSRAQDLFDLLAKFNLKLVLNGHDHNFQYFQSDINSKDISEIVVGTGGHSLYKMEDNSNPNFKYGNFDSFGYLKLDLFDNGKFEFKFVEI